MNENALTGVKEAASWLQISTPSSATSAKPSVWPKVATTFSLAIRPVTDATAFCQLPQPSGANSGAIPLPIAASTLLLMSETAPNAPFSQP